MGAITIANYSLIWTMCDREEPSKFPLIKVLSVPHCSKWPSKHLFTEHLLSHVRVNCLLPLWNTAPSSFSLVQDVTYSSTTKFVLRPHILVEPPHCTYIIKFYYSLLLICLMPFQLIQQLEELCGKRGNFPPPHCHSEESSFLYIDQAAICPSYRTWHSQGLFVNFSIICVHHFLSMSLPDSSTHS